MARRDRYALTGRGRAKVALAAVAVTDCGMKEALLARIKAMEKDAPTVTDRPISTGKEPSAREGKDA